MTSVSKFSRAVRNANSLHPRFIYKALLGHVKNMTFVSRRKTLKQDRKGIDYVVHRRNMRPLFVDLKQLNHVPEAEDKILLETSISGKNTSPGWASDDSKWTDLVLLVRGDDSIVILSSRRVREALIKYRHEWSKHSGRNWTQGFFETYACDYVLVPRKELEHACNEIAAGWRN